MTKLLFTVAIAIVRGWTRLYTCCMKPALRDARRAEIESDLWEFHEDVQWSVREPAGLAAHVLARLLLGMPHDLLWRFEQAVDCPRSRRRSVWVKAAAAAAGVCVAAALWMLFSLAAPAPLPPFPANPLSVTRVRLRPPPPPPPPTAPRAPR
jgi:hypothetical protein